MACCGMFHAWNRAARAGEYLVKQRQLTEGASLRSTSCSTEIENLAERVRADDRQRLLEPTSLPKELRGFKRRPPANTAVLSNIAFEAFKARMWADGHDLTDEQAERMFKGTFV